jgi:hypothetical protein
MVDHQLDPLLEVCRTWIDDPYTPDATPAQRRATAESLAALLRVAADHVAAMGTQAEPLDIECDTCGAPKGQMCWHLGHYGDLKHPHPVRVEAARGLVRADLW